VQQNYLFFTAFDSLRVKQPRLGNCTILERSFCNLLSDNDRFPQYAVFGAKMVQKRCSFPVCTRKQEVATEAQRRSVADAATKSTWTAQTRLRFGPLRHVAARKAATCCRSPKSSRRARILTDSHIMEKPETKSTDARDDRKLHPSSSRLGEASGAAWVGNPEIFNTDAGFPLSPARNASHSDAGGRE